MTEVDRDIALALLKRLKDRKIITERQYLEACNSRILFAERTEGVSENAGENHGERRK